MQLARVVGQVVTTVKDVELDGLTLLLVQDVVPDDPESPATREAYVAVDLVGAGDGEVVLVTRGSAARTNPRAARAPTDRAVVSIVDSVIHQGTVTFAKP